MGPSPEKRYGISKSPFLGQLTLLDLQPSVHFLLPGTRKICDSRFAFFIATLDRDNLFTSDMNQLFILSLVQGEWCYVDAIAVLHGF